MHPPEGVVAVGVVVAAAGFHTAEAEALAGMAAASVVAVAAAGMPCAVMAAGAMPCAVMVAASEFVLAGGRVRASVMAVLTLTVRVMRVADSSVAITSIVEGMVIGIEGTDGGDTAGLWLPESALQLRARITALVGDGTVGSG